jgi:hypothetical protein
VTIVGGALVVLIGVAMIADWLSRIPSLFPFLTAV